MGSSSDPTLTDANSMYFKKSNPGARFGRNIPLDQAFPEEGAGPDDAQPARGQHRPARPPDLHPGNVAELPRRRLDPVPDP